MEFDSTKRNRCRRSGLPVDSPLALFWDCKNSPSLYEMDHKCPCVLALELFDVSGLSCVSPRIPLVEILMNTKVHSKICKCNECTHKLSLRTNTQEKRWLRASLLFFK